MTTNPVVRIGNASPARYLQEARRAVSPEEFAAGVLKVWEGVMVRGDVRAFLAVAPYLTGALKQDEGGQQQTVIDQFVKVLEQRQQAALAMTGAVLELEGEVADE